MKEMISSVTFLAGSLNEIENTNTLNTTTVFDDTIVNFLHDLSISLLKDFRAKGHSDVITFAYWCRKGSISTIKSRYSENLDRIGKGTSFHITPSNVPVLFAFSLVLSLLAGNRSIVKISSKDFPQVKIICDNINELLNQKYPTVKKMVFIVRYPHNQEINEYFTSLCDVRIIWGGNNTIQEIRNAKLRADSTEIPFYDRFSISLINSDEYNEVKDKKEFARKFYNDTYFSDQNACTSPILVIWVGKEKNKAKKDFWDSLNEYAETKYSLQPIQGIDKYAMFCKLSIKYPSVRVLHKSNLLWRIQIDKLYDDLEEFKCPGGFFFEYEANNLDDINKILRKNCQTLSIYGLDSSLVKEHIIKFGLRGVDRIVPIGETMEFDVIWDGYDMITELSRIIHLRL
ncbi:MAG: acyl-CoA reductase [Bacillota bacterium]